MESLTKEHFDIFRLIAAFVADLSLVESISTVHPHDTMALRDSSTGEK